jgi:predicted nucleotidyltransferase
MSSNWRIDWTRPPTDRRDLADKICALLQQERRVEAAELFGSLTSSEPDGFPADEMSDIDIHVDVQGATDRAFYDSLEGILVAGGLRPLAKNLFAGSQGIVANFMFEGYSPFWSVDIVCRASARESCADLLHGSVPVRAFGSWLSAVKKSVRADMFLGFFTDLVPGTSVGILHRPHELFSTLLDEWMSLYNDPLRYEIGREVLQHLYSRRV